jgi:hypothetical protein
MAERTIRGWIGTWKGGQASIPVAPRPAVPEPRPAEPEAPAGTAVPFRDEPDEEGKRGCARGAQCSSGTAVTEGGKTRHKPERSYQPFCPKDRTLLEADLREMPAQFAYLAAEIGNPVKNGQMIHAPFGPRIPVRTGIDALMRAIVESLSSWHERVADADHLSYPDAGVSRLQRQMVAVRNAERVLRHRVDPLLALDSQPMLRTLKVTSERDPDGRDSEDIAENISLDGLDAGMEIFTLHYLCRAVLGETKAAPDKLLGVPCRREECDQLALRRAGLPSDPKAKEWWSECSACGDRLTGAEYRDWTIRYARWAQGKTVPVLENLPGVA